MTMTGIYAIRNTRTGKVYVGSSNNIQSRWSQHMSALRRGAHASIKLLRSFVKHGEAAFCLEVLEECAAEELFDREQFWCDQLRAREDGYNVRKNVATNKGTAKSAEWRANMSALMSVKMNTPEMKAKMSAKMSAAHSTAPLSEATRAKLRAAQAARMSKPGYAESLRENARRLNSDPDYRKRHKAAMNRPEVRAKIAKALSERVCSDSTREKRRIAVLSRWEPAGARERHSAAVKAAWGRKRAKIAD